jgi:hypothetical protein
MIVRTAASYNNELLITRGSVAATPILMVADQNQEWWSQMG